VRASSSGLRGWVERPREGRGTGAVKATGSYEGFLPREGILGYRKHRPSRVGVESGLGSFPITITSSHAQQDDDEAGTHESDVQNVVNGKRRQGCQRLDWLSRRGKKTPTLVSGKP
jgi:hypothetical protein